MLIPHLGAVGVDGPWGRMTLDSREAKRIAELFDLARIVPIHHHTFSHDVEPIAVLEQAVSATVFLCREIEGGVGGGCGRVEVSFRNHRRTWRGRNQSGS